MTKINIVLADSDELYLNKLTNYFIEKTNAFEVYSFTSMESLANYTGDKQNKIDMIAFTEDFMSEEISIADIPAKILLSDSAGDKAAGFDAVNKYQKAEKFINEMLIIYAEKTGRVEAVATGNKQTKVIGVYSPVGGCGKTTMALALSITLANAGMRVFYLNYEIVNSTVKYLSAASSSSFSDVFLSVKTKGANVALRIVANKLTDSTMKISYINPPESALELNELTITEQIKLIRELDGLGEFDAVVVDFDSAFTQQKQELLDACDIILMPFTADTMSLCKIELLLNEFKMHSELSNIFKKLYLAVNKTDGQTNLNLQNSGILNIKPVEVTMPLSPVFSEVKNLPYSVEGMQKIFTGFMNRVWGGGHD